MTGIKHYDYSKYFAINHVIKVATIANHKSQYTSILFNCYDLMLCLCICDKQLSGYLCHQLPLGRRRCMNICFFGLLLKQGTQLIN